MRKFLQSLLTSASLVLLVAGPAMAKDEAKPAASAAAPSMMAPATPAKIVVVEQLDLNSASEKDLATLPQIGEARSKAIVKARPYKRKDELVSKKVLSQSVYDGIKDRVIAKQTATK